MTEHAVEGGYLAAGGTTVKCSSGDLGPASGPVLHAALALAARTGFAGRLLVAALPDAAERYLEHWMPESPS